VDSRERLPPEETCGESLAGDLPERCWRATVPGGELPGEHGLSKTICDVPGAATISEGGSPKETICDVPGAATLGVDVPDVATISRGDTGGLSNETICDVPGAATIGITISERGLSKTICDVAGAATLGVDVPDVATAVSADTGISADTASPTVNREGPRGTKTPWPPEFILFTEPVFAPGTAMANLGVLEDLIGAFGLRSSANTPGTATANLGVLEDLMGAFGLRSSANTPSERVAAARPGAATREDFCINPVRTAVLDRLRLTGGGAAAIMVLPLGEACLRTPCAATECGRYAGV